MKNYYRIMPGPKSIYAEECFRNHFIGTDYDIHQDLTNDLSEDWRDFNRKFIPIFLKNRPDKTKIAAGLACGAVHTICKGMNRGDIVICPDGKNKYMVGEITGEYKYVPDGILPHRREVKWWNRTFDRSEMTQPLKYSTGSTGTVCDISKYSGEIETLIGGKILPVLVSADETIEDVSEFAMEKYLEEFIISNWTKLDLGKKYDIYKEDNESGNQYQIDSHSRIDILAISKDKKEILVVELKKGRASDAVVGQIQRYMGTVLEELADEDQKVRGIIIAGEEDPKIRRALAVTNNIEFYIYKVSFELIKTR